ncbi:hypothetical protein K0M31_014691 [Melipona bicolor]|uniref:Uncharacterized protein n=1 Tax=Melipona bicolor TaxID=60889 RepID=A0AA40FHE7_9HYME|nr:hypothetical protein K0M31_014691 [Melipona bicolor]
MDLEFRDPEYGGSEGWNLGFRDPRLRETTNSDPTLWDLWKPRISTWRGLQLISTDHEITNSTVREVDLARQVPQCSFRVMEF